MHRRDFFKFGHKGLIPKTDWELFLHRVQRLTLCDLKIIDSNLNIAYIELRDNKLIPTLLGICSDHKVAFLYKKLVDQEAVSGRSSLIFDVIEEAIPISISEGECMASFNSLCGDLFRIGYHQFDYVPPNLNLSQWFNNPIFHDERPYYSITSGLLDVEAIFSNQLQGTLGAFGLESTSVLNNTLLNKCIPELFKISQTSEIVELLDSGFWPNELRFDSLYKKITDINLGRVFLGQKGCYLWANRFHLKALPPKKIIPKNKTIFEDDWEFHINPVSLLDLKMLMDPEGIFGYEDEYNENT